MDSDTLKKYLLNKPETLCTFPFGEDVFVYKVKNKIFALLGNRTVDGRDAIQVMLNLKCDPDEAQSLCDVFASIKPGYHANKKHWVSVYFDPVEGSDVPNGEVKRLIDNSYLLVVDKLTKAQQVSVRLKL